ncbi:MAG TPA: ABC transporter permease [Lacunisphaera sp.]|jgi:putative ABC transport system permease protein
MSWFSALFRRKAHERELDAELRFHLERRIDEEISAGINPVDARRQAAIEFGGLEQIKEQCRDTRRGHWLEETLQDIRYALGGLRRSPGFTSAMLATIAVGVGSAVAIFSFFDAALLKPPAYPNADRIVKLFDVSHDGTWGPISVPDYLDLTAQTTVCEGVTAEFLDEVALRGTEAPVQLLEKRVSVHYFDVFRVRPALGRTFVDGEDQAGRDNVVILSNKIWESRFGGAPNVIGRVLFLNGKPHTVIGVMPPGGVVDRQGIEIFRPLAFTADDMARDHRWLNVYAMLKPGISLKQGLAEMDAIGGRIASANPVSNKGRRITLLSYARSLLWSDLEDSLHVLMAAVAVVMLIACTNLANLTLARGIGRVRETATRAALGAGRWRLMRQFLTESILLSVGGGILGLFVGYGGMSLLKMAPPGGYLPTPNSVTMDGRVILFATGLSLLCGILFGLFPAIRISQFDLNGILSDGNSRSGTGRHIRGISGALIIAEIALAFVLLGSCGLLAKSFLKMRQIDLGFDPKNLAETYLPFGKTFSSAQDFSLYLRQITDRIAAVPGVQSVALTSTPPLTYHGWGLSMPFQIAGRNTTGSSLPLSCGFKVVSPSYFRTLGIRLIKGRFLSDRDGNGNQPVTVISESMAHRYFSDLNPVGEHLLISELDFRAAVPGRKISAEIVGVVGNERNESPHGESSAGIYVSGEQNPLAWQFLVVRGNIAVDFLDNSMRRALGEIDPDQVMEGLVTFEKIRSDYLATDRRRSCLFATFAGIALLLAALGIYGVISYSVAQRTREIGIRSALGATSLDMLGLVLRGGSKFTVIGLGLGFVASLGLFRLLDSMLYDVGKYDTTTLLVVAVVLFTTALLACFIPARRATKVNPIVALRCE